MRSKIAGNTGLAARLAVFVLVFVRGASVLAADGRLLWSTASHVRPAASPAGRNPPEPVVGDGIVAWTTGGGIHAVRLDDGSPLSPGDGPRGSTELLSLALFFPGDSPPSEAGLSRPCHRGGRLFTTLVAPARGGERPGRLVAIDCSPAGMGRVEWFAAVPAGTVAFEGSPWVDGERVLAIVVGDGARATRRLAAYDLFDGRLLETRLAGEADRPQEGTGHRVAAGRDRVVVATERTIECRVSDARP